MPLTIRPTPAEADALAGQYKTIPLSAELYADIATPVNVLRVLKNVSRHCFLLESAEDPARWGRYTFLGFDPQLEISCQDGTTALKTPAVTRREVQPPGPLIRKILADNRSPRLEYLPPFSGGLVGYFSYDFIKYAEPSLNLNARDEEGFNDVDLMLFDKVVAFDHFRQKILLIVNVKAEHLDTEYNRGAAELHSLAALIAQGGRAPAKPGRLAAEFKPLFDKDTFCAMVEQAQHFIREGDIFQAVLSNRLAAEFEGSLLDTYRVLRGMNPSPYMFYLGSDDMEVAGASPETLVKLYNGRLHTFPLAGTRPRGRDHAEDAALERELLSDEKELAEHTMLVDLGRNDLGKVSQFGSVVVERYRSVEKFSHVMHIGSTVAGDLLPGKTALDALNAVLPAGTLSGAPKLRAMEIINALENNKRGIYGGAVGYLDFTGGMDTCIAIRLAFRKNGKVFARSGAGSVADSVPEREYEECAGKLKAVLEALGQAEGGIV
jgi:anthranilate synthase component 1